MPEENKYKVDYLFMVEGSFEVEASDQQQAQDKGLSFVQEIVPHLPAAAKVVTKAAAELIAPVVTETLRLEIECPICSSPAE